MKTYVLWLALITSSWGFAQTPDQRFEEANRSYESHRYREARVLYEKLLSEGAISKELYYNYANACFRTQSLGISVLYYEKAKRIDPDDEEISANLQIVQSRLKDKIVTPPDFVLFQWVRTATHLLSINSLVRLFLTLFYIFTFFILFLWYTKRNGPLLRALRRTGISILLLVFTITIYRIHAENTQHEAIIIAPSVNVQNEPLPDGSVSCVIHEGTKITIRSERDVWIEIRLPDGITGWILRQTAEAI